IFVLSSGDEPIDPTTWNDYMGALASYSSSPRTRRRLIVDSGDSIPNAMQRANFNQKAVDYNLKVGVLARTRVARGAVMAFNWLSKIDMKGFEPEDFEGLCAWLGIPEHAQPMITDWIRLRR
ncbi:MAG: hypothetical protein AAFQ82_27235, partial [Myxococcota bacterium]